MKKTLLLIIPLSVLLVLTAALTFHFFAETQVPEKVLSSDLSDEELLYLLNEYDFDLSVLSDDESEALSIVRTLINTIETDPDYSFQFSGFVYVSGFANRLKLYVATE